MDRCNVSAECIRWGLKSQRLSRSLIELQGDFVELGLRVARKIGALGKVLTQQPIGILVRATLPRAVWVAEVHLRIGSEREVFMRGHLFTSIPGQGAAQLPGQFAYAPGESGDHSLSLAAGDFYQHQKARFAFDQSGNVRSARPHQQIAFPVAWNGTILRLSRALADRDGIADLSTPGTVIGVTPATSQHAAAAKVRRELLFQHSARLDKQAFVDRLMRHPHTLIVAKLSCKPAGDLLRGPLQTQLLRDHSGQLRVSRQVTGLGTKCSIPGTLIRNMSSVTPPSCAVACNLTANTGGRAAKPPGDLPNRLMCEKPARDLLALSQRQGKTRPATPPRSKSSSCQRSSGHRSGLPADCSGYRSRRLPGLPAPPQFRPLFGRKPWTQTHMQPPIRLPSDHVASTD